MAFYAEMVRRNSFYVNSMNMVEYTKKLRYEAEREKERQEQERKIKEYEEWYQSLTDEERAEVDRKNAENKMKEKEAVMRPIMDILLASAMIMEAYAGRPIGRYDKYGSLYNYDGTVNENYFKEKQEEVDTIDVEAVEV